MRAPAATAFLLTLHACCAHPSTAVDGHPEAVARAAEPKGDPAKGDLLQRVGQLRTRMTRREVVAILGEPLSTEPLDARDGEVCEWQDRSLTAMMPPTDANLHETRFESQTAKVTFDHLGKVSRIELDVISTH